jgi:hypothetical protein
VGSTEFSAEATNCGGRNNGLSTEIRRCRKSRDAQAHRRASCGTIRLKLLKIGALVRTSVRRIKLALRSAFPIKPSTMPLTPR